MKEQNYLDNLVGVFGHPVAENPGAVIQQAAFDDLGLTNWRFLTIDVKPEDLEAAVLGLKAFGMRGINCTIPHKIRVIPLLDEVSESARLIGAVNTVINRGGRLYGDNTDGKGFMISLAENGISARGKRAVVLGAGGATRAVSVELALAGALHITVVNRPEDRDLGDALVGILRGSTQARVDYVDWDRPFAVPEDTQILVNATSVGLYPRVEELPRVELDSITPAMFVQDVIPNPVETALIREMRRRGIPCATGAGMLVAQAALNIEMWTGLKPNPEVMLRALAAALE